MMKLKDYSLALVCVVVMSIGGWAQQPVSVQIVDAISEWPIESAEVYVLSTQKTYRTDKNGYCVLNGAAAETYDIIAFAEGFQAMEYKVETEDGRQDTLRFELLPLQVDLNAIIIRDELEDSYALGHLRAVEGTAIYAGKKTEVVLLDQLTANLASNNARQIYSQVTGLNIYESGDAGLQLSIGGRGLDPNRSASFNTRQNGYDISADVLGYPESYYTPPAEALGQVQVIRGAASLQYGTQFGGLVNFKFRKPEEERKVEWISRQTAGSNALFTSFNSLSGTIGKLSYYTFFNYKRGNSFRPNSGFESFNYFAHLGYAFSERTQLELEVTYLNYLAQQAGGLTDAQFYRDPFVSNRSRNWFEVDWQLYSAKLKHRFSPKTNLSVNWFGLSAARNALGFRTNRVSQVDDPEAPRDLIKGTFNNWGVESRMVHRYQLGKNPAVLLLGTKVYQSENTAVQGPGTAAADANFSLATARYPFYPNQSDFNFPNFNLAFFGEQIFYLSDQLSVTPGFRMEYIRTQSEGTFRKIDFDLAGNPIRDQAFQDDRVFDRKFVLFGLGLSYKPMPAVELFGNISQNYRSVTFSDIRIVNPSFQVDPDITDENGFTADLGWRGRWRSLSYNMTAFGLLYDGRLGEVLRAETRVNAEGELEETGRVVRFRGNIGRAFIYGLESLVDWKVLSSSSQEQAEYRLNVFLNTALTHSEYLRSEIPGVESNEVEFIPLLNLKCGSRFVYQKVTASLQFTYLSRQFTDASNAPQDVRDNQSGIVGAIPAYHILDFSASWKFFKHFKLEGGVNNLTNNYYFTRRATGYPGPGIIPSAPRTFYLGLEMKW
jgi:Fe(3+) dicitrate transport protein